MSNLNKLSRMGRSDRVDYKKSAPKKALKKNKGSCDDDDSSVDSNGNIRDLIDYEYTSDELEEVKSPKKTRRAAIAAQKKINAINANKKNLEKKVESKSTRIEPSTTKLDSVVNSTSPVAKLKVKKNKRLTPIKRKASYKPIKKSIKKLTPSTLTTSESSNLELDESSLYTSGDDSSDEYDDSETESVDDNGDQAINESESESDEDYTIEDDDDDEDYDDEENTGRTNKGFGGILLTLGGGAGGGVFNTMTPKKYNMKKEPEIIKKFVKLLTQPTEENTLDTQITQFKALSEEKQKDLIVALENRPVTADNGISLMLKILTLKLPSDVQGMILSKYNSLQNLDNSSSEYFKLRAWLDKVVNIPFGICKDIPVRLDDGVEKCSNFMKTARKCLDDAVYGQDESKLQIMQFIGTKIANPDHRGLNLLLHGAPGIGKTSIIKNGIAKALGWPFQFISLGGDSDASTYTGHQLVYESSHCGKIVNSLIASKSMSTVLMFDEVDKISQTPKGEEVMNLLIHLTDPVQNEGFEDKYLAGVPIDLSKVMFVFSANDISKIDKVLLDRMMVIDLKGYDIKQKTAIAEHYLLPTALKDVNLTERISISKEILTHVIEEYANEEKGVRELKRCIEQITQKINMLRMYNSPELPFHIKDFSLPFIVKKEHIKLFLKKKENRDAVPQGMYL